MGRTYTPTHRIEFQTSGSVMVTPSCWDRKNCGNPTKKNLDKHMQFLIASFAVGGVNCFNTKPPVFTEAKLIKQDTDEVVATWRCDE